MTRSEILLALLETAIVVIPVHARTSRGEDGGEQR